MPKENYYKKSKPKVCFKKDGSTFFMVRDGLLY